MLVNLKMRKEKEEEQLTLKALNSFGFREYQNWGLRGSPPLARANLSNTSRISSSIVLVSKVKGEGRGWKERRDERIQRVHTFFEFRDFQADVRIDPQQKF